MKAFIALCLVAVIASAAADVLTTPEQLVKLVEYRKECALSSKVEQEAITKTNAGVFSDDPKVAEYFDCMFKKTHFVDDEGHILVKNIEESAHNVDKEEFAKVVAACEGEAKQATKDKVAKVTYECFITKTGGKHKIFPDTA